MGHVTNGTREYWMYEIHKGQGVYQGSTGPGAEGIVRRVVEMAKAEGENPGEPFRVFCFEGHDPNMPTPLEMFQADHRAAQDAGFESPGEVLSAYNTLVQKHDWCAERLQKAEELLEQVAGERRRTGTLSTVALDKIEQHLRGKE